jgi:hypothetical protein
MLLIVVQPVFHHPSEPLMRCECGAWHLISRWHRRMGVSLVMIMFMVVIVAAFMFVMALLPVMMVMVSMVTTHGKLLICDWCDNNRLKTLKTAVLRLTRLSAYASFLKRQGAC